MSEVAGTSPATTRPAALPQSFRSLLLAHTGDDGRRPGRPLTGVHLPSRLRVGSSQFDPKPSAPGKLAKNRRCKSPTGKV
jgi:hypothetical protein